MPNYEMSSEEMSKLIVLNEKKLNKVKNGPDFVTPNRSKRAFDIMSHFGTKH